MRPQLILSALLIGCSSLVAAFSKGAPNCIANPDLMIAQKTMGNPAELGYTISAKDIAKGYTPGGPAVKVTLGNTKNAKGTFKGLLVYAIDAAKNHVGSFKKPDNLQFKTGCQGDDGTGTLTHMDSTDKPLADLLWTPPKAGTGKVTFISTFVAGKAIGFQMVKSIDYQELGGKTPAGNDTAAPTSTPAATPSAPVGATPSPTPDSATPSPTPSQQSNGGMSVSQYSSFGALALANIAAAVMLL